MDRKISWNRVQAHWRPVMTTQTKPPTKPNPDIPDGPNRPGDIPQQPAETPPQPWIPQQPDPVSQASGAPADDPENTGPKGPPISRSFRSTFCRMKDFFTMRRPAAMLAALICAALFSAPRLPAHAPQILTFSYRSGGDADRELGELDLFKPPRSAAGTPVLIFVHGGAWSAGDKTNCRALGLRFAKHGVLAVLPNYRLSPVVQYPVQIEDVAAAVAWTVRHAGEYGGNSSRIFLAGHSSGGHIAALLAADPVFLAGYGLKPTDLAGVIVISGVYDIDTKEFDGGRIAEFRKTVFGKDPGTWKAANPITHLKPASPQRAELPRTMIVWAGRDHDFLRREGAALRDALLRNGNQPVVMLMEEYNHATEVWLLGNPGQPLSDAMYGFMGHRPESQ
jgi:acetyl esterase/lipase